MADLQPAAYTEAEAAIFLGISVATLRKMRDGMAGVSGPLYILIGRSVRYRKSDLSDWLDQFPGYRHRGEHGGLVVRK